MVGTMCLSLHLLPYLLLLQAPQWPFFIFKWNPLKQKCRAKRGQDFSFSICWWFGGLGGRDGDPINPQKLGVKSKSKSTDSGPGCVCFLRLSFAKGNQSENRCHFGGCQRKKGTNFYKN